MQPIGIVNREDLATEPDAGGLMPRASGVLMGHLLASQGRLRPQDIDRVLIYAGTRRIKFGEAAVKLGLISRSDLDHAVAAQFGYPYLEKGAGGLSTRLVAAFEPFSAKGNAIRVLKAQLSQRWFSTGQQALAVIGPGGRDGCSYVAANLAIAFSQLGESTVLVDADLREPAQHRLFKTDNGAGLSAALVGQLPVDAVVTRLPQFRNLSLVPAGVTPPNIYDVFGRAELERVIEGLRSRFSVILFDTPPYVADLGAEAVARRCGGALVVIRRDHTRLADARDLLRAIGEAGAAVVGTALTQY